MALVVSDTSPLRALSHVRLLPILKTLFGEVFVPPAVAAELIRAKRVPSLDVTLVEGLVIRAPQDGARVNALRATLGPGESEAITVAIEIGAGLVLIDESQGRSAARRLGLQPIGTLGVLVRAKERGLVNEVKPLIQTLRSGINFAVSDAVVAASLRSAGES